MTAISDLVLREISVSMGGPWEPKRKIRELMLKVRWGKGYVYIKPFNKMLFYGNGDYSGWQSKNLKLQLRMLETINNGIQQGGGDPDPYLTNALRQSIKLAMGL